MVIVVIPVVAVVSLVLLAIVLIVEVIDRSGAIKGANGSLLTGMPYGDLIQKENGRKVGKNNRKSNIFKRNELLEEQEEDSTTPWRSTILSLNFSVEGFQVLSPVLVARFHNGVKFRIFLTPGRNRGLINRGYCISRITRSYAVQSRSGLGLALASNGVYCVTISLVH